MEKRRYTREEVREHTRMLLEKLKSNDSASTPGWCGTPRLLADLYRRKEREQGKK